MAPATYQYILMGIGASVFAVNQGGYVYLNAPNLDVDGASPKTYALTVSPKSGTSEQTHGMVSTCRSKLERSARPP